MASGSQDFPFGILDVAELLHLRIRRRQANSSYVDCPFCGDRRGKMNINHAKNVWRCNYCGESGGMLALYARLNNTTNSDAFREICDALQTGETSWGYESREQQPDRSRVFHEGLRSTPAADGEQIRLTGVFEEEIPQSPLASVQEIDQTLSLLFGMLSLRDVHRKHLRSPKRGLTDEQIDMLGFKSTPPPFLCRSLTERLIKQGCTVQGVPGFYLDKDGKWTVKFHSRTAGILIPAVGVDGMLRGAQILLDVPIKDKDDPPEKTGTKYLWLSSSNKNMGATSGSPVHFIGNPFARTVYVTEGLLKADIAHCLMNRSFVAIAGANNVRQLEPLFALLAQNGTELIVESHDMDKFSNQMTSKGASQIYLIARKCGMDCRRLTWNPNYKGVDDWQLALRQKEKQQKEEPQMNFKQMYLSDQCGFELLTHCVEVWHNRQEDNLSLAEYLGLSEAEYCALEEDNTGNALKELLETQRQHRKFRIYQLEFDERTTTIPYAFKGIDALHKAGYEQPPAADYCLVYEDKVICPGTETDTKILEQIFKRYSSHLPEDYEGRPLAPSDVVELYDEEGRYYFYRDVKGFIPVRFSPFFAKSRL